LSLFPAFFLVGAAFLFGGGGFTGLPFLFGLATRFGLLLPLAFRYGLLPPFLFRPQTRQIRFRRLLRGLATSFGLLFGEGA
jgi:hypothetical protein